MKENLVTVVIPAYNRSKVIESAVSSALSQSYENLEIIIVDDGSHDDTGEIINKVINSDNRVKYIAHPSNLGAQAARNTGIRNANGDWITFLDSDDYLQPKSLESRLHLALKDALKVVHAECYVINSDNQLRLFGVPPMEGNVYIELLTNPGPVFPGLFVAKDALEKINYLDDNIIAYQEWDTSIRLAKLYPFGFVKNPVFTYDCRGQDTISKDTIRGANGYKQVIEKHWNEIINLAGPLVLSKHLLNLRNLYDSARR
jgi:glycosyltransferase involved in cell wall biosynthesis